MHPPEIEAFGLNDIKIFQRHENFTLSVQYGTGSRKDKGITRLRGKYRGHRTPKELHADIAMDATLHAAAARLLSIGGKKLEVQTQDLREKLRSHRSHYAIAFVFDNSWSMQTEITLEKIKGLAFDLLKNARSHRDKVALIAFRHSRRPGASVFLPLTSSYNLAMRRLRQIPVSGTTPLGDGMQKALKLLRQEKFKHNSAVPVMVIISDGLPNVAVKRGGDVREEITQLSRTIYREKIHTIVVNTDPDPRISAKSLCPEIAGITQGKYLRLSELNGLKTDFS